MPPNDPPSRAPARRDTDGQRPVVAVDVDGDLNPSTPAAPQRAATGSTPTRDPGPNGRHATGAVWLNPHHGTWLLEIAEHADPVWCSSWGQRSATWIAPRLGLPTTWPVLDLPGPGGIRWGHQTKLGHLYRHTGTRPVAVLDDQIGGKDPDTAQRRTTAGVPTLLVPVDGVTGIRRQDVDAVLAWLHDR